MHNLNQASRPTFTSGEAARMCGLGLSTLKRWIRRGALRAYRTPGGDLRIRRADLLDFMRAYGIPLAEGADEAGEGRRLLILMAADAHENERARERLARIRAAAATLPGGVRVEAVASELELGFALAKGGVGHVLIESADPATDRARCEAARRSVAPASLRIALLHTPDSLRRWETVPAATASPFADAAITGNAANTANTANTANSVDASEAPEAGDRTDIIQDAGPEVTAVADPNADWAPRLLAHLFGCAPLGADRLAS